MESKTGQAQVRTEQHTGLVGIVRGQVARVAVVNLGSSPAMVMCGLWQNPPLAKQTFTLDPGKSATLDLSFKKVPDKFIDRYGRAEVRATCKCSDPLIAVTFQVFDIESGKTQIVLPAATAQSVVTLGTDW